MCLLPPGGRRTAFVPALPEGYSLFHSHLGRGKDGGQRPRPFSGVQLQVLAEGLAQPLPIPQGISVEQKPEHKAAQLSWLSREGRVRSQRKPPF